MESILKKSCEDFLKNMEEKENEKLQESRNFEEEGKNIEDTNDVMKDIYKNFSAGKNQVKSIYSNESYSSQINDEEDKNEK